MHTPHSFIRPEIILLTAILLLATGCKKSLPDSTPSANSPMRSPIQSTATTNQKLHPTQTVTVGEHIFYVQVATTELDQTQGLSGIESIQKNEGMLFSFDSPTQPAFWMKDMKFSIDILWIRNNKVVAISERLAIPQTGQSEQQLPLYVPPTKIDAALEINAGLAKSYAVHLGDLVKTDGKAN